MNPITLDTIKLMLDMLALEATTDAQKEEAQSIINKLLRFMQTDIDAVIAKNSKFLKG